MLEAAVSTSVEVRLPLETARIIRAVFLPHNPNKMRKPDPEVLAAVTIFIEALRYAELGNE
jgi:hypothetical protein